MRKSHRELVRKLESLGYRITNIEVQTKGNHFRFTAIRAAVPSPTPRQPPRATTAHNSTASPTFGGNSGAPMTTKEIDRILETYERITQRGVVPKSRWLEATAEVLGLEEPEVKEVLTREGMLK